MNQSFFAEYVQRIFPKLSKIIETINGKRDGQSKLTYLHKTMLRREYSADQKWESASVNTTMVAADMVAMDSPLPIKKRDSIATSNGVLPKVGMKKILRETQINSLNIMKANNASFESIAKKLIDDALACSVGIDEKNEYNFLYALSNGIVLVDDDTNTGTALRVNYHYPEANIFGVETAGEISYDDVRRPIAKANEDGNTITHIAVSMTMYNRLRNTRWAKELAANYRGMAYSADTTLPVPTAAVFDDAFADDNNGIKFIKIDRSVKIEKNGVLTSVKPFNADRLIYLCSEEVGALVWGTLAEANNPVKMVDYTTVDEYKLISKYSTPDPFQEITSGQALVLPVIENVDQIYVLDSTDAESVDSSEEGKDTGDVKVTIKGKTYVKSSVIAALNTLGVKTAANASDAVVIKNFNKLSNEQEAEFFKLVTEAESSSSN